VIHKIIVNPVANFRVVLATTGNKGTRTPVRITAINPGKHFDQLAAQVRVVPGGTVHGFQG
jgi:hypothetical protein